MRSLLSFIAVAAFGATLTNASGQTVSGTVRDMANIPLTGVRVTLYTTDTSFFRENRTNAVGAYQFTAIPAGTYSVNASRSDLAYKRVSITANGTGPITQDLVVTIDTVMGRWDVLLNAPEPLGGTNLCTLLPDGRLFYCHNTTDPFIFNPATNQAAFIPGAGTVQGCVGLAMRTDSTLVFIGGAAQDGYGPGTRSVKTWRASTGQWSAMQPVLDDYRWYPSTTTLPDGRVLTVGGGNENNPERTNTSELLGPYSLATTVVDTIDRGNEQSPILLLHNGKVLMTHRPPQRFDPYTYQWTLTGDFVQGNRMPNGDHADHELVLLPEGNVVAIGYRSFTPGVYGNMVEVYNPAAGTWSLGTNTTSVRSRPETILLPNKKILVLAGAKENPADPTPVNAWGFTKLAHYYDPYSASWRQLKNMNWFREYHATAVQVPDGRVIVAGGEGAPGNNPPLSVIEGFTPPYLFKGVRPVVAQLADKDLARGESITLNFSRTNALTGIILQAQTLVTHMMDCGNNRFVQLPFTLNGTQATATLPTDPLALPNGFYLLTGMVDDIPAVSQIVRITGATVPTVSLAVKAWLQGPFNTGPPMLMQDSLRRQPGFPLSEPYTALGFVNVAGGGSESTTPGVLSVGGNNAIVDWVRLELRASSNPALLVATRNALLQRDGDVVSASDGVSNPSITIAPGMYHVAIRHRNHLGCMRAAPLALSSAGTTIDFRSTTTTTYGTNAQQTVGTQRALWAGNTAYDSPLPYKLKYTGMTNDRDRILTVVGSTTPNATVLGYVTSDTNMDGRTRYTGSGNDRDIILQNIGGTTPNATRPEQLP